MGTITGCKQTFENFPLKCMSYSSTPTTLIFLIKAYIASIVAIEDKL